MENINTPSTEASEADKKLEGILFHFIELYNKSKKEKIAISDQSEKLNSAVKAFENTQVALNASADEFKQIASVVTEQLVMHLQHSVTTLEDNLSKQVNSRLTAHINETTKKLDHASNNAISLLGKSTNILNKFQNKLITYHWKFFIVTIFCAIGSAFLVSKYLTPDYPLSDDTVKMLAVGAEMENLWPTLSNKTKEKIKQKTGNNSILSTLN